ncbi:MAG TPA: hypothetical protein VIO64_15550 [Pseudobacteroides sp.]|uniref:hypothetical protein n=1 Tax=Pseudobacteroides sp. TaxID=1968840 RepID=UPI002F9327DA
MAFRNGLISFLIVIVTSLITIAAGIILIVKFKNGFNALRLTGILLILIAVVMLLFSKKVCIRNVRLKENIVVTPMTNLQISSNIKSVKDIIESIESFSSFEVNTTNGVNTAVSVKRSDGIIEMLTGVDPKGAHLDIKVSVFDSVENACKSYNFNYKNYSKDYGIMNSSGTENDRYFVTYKNQLRSSAETMFQLTDTYVTYVFFQKGNMIIRLWETRDSGDSSKIDSYINLLSNKLSTLK